MISKEEYEKRKKKREETGLQEINEERDDDYDDEDEDHGEGNDDQGEGQLNQ